MKYLLIIIIISLFFIDCENSNKQVKNHILKFDINVAPNISRVKLSDLEFREVVYIPLETNTNCLIQKIDKVFMGGNFILIKHLDKILKFNINGSFMTKIGAEGRGPDEISGILDIDIDAINQNIYLLSGSHRKFYIYSAEGELIKIFHSPLYTNCFKIVEDGLLCYCMNIPGNTEFSYILINQNGHIVKKISNKYPYNVRYDRYFIQNENIFYKYENKVFLKDVYSDTVFEYKESINFIPRLIIEQGSRTITTKARSDFDPSYLLENYNIPSNLFEFGDYVYYEFIKFPTSLSFIASKKHRLNFLYNSEQGIIDDLNGGPNIKPEGIINDNTLIGWIDANQLKEYVGSNEFKNANPKYPEQKIKLEILAKSLKETDNPILILIK